MTMREQVLQEALALSPEDRIFVADHLEQSLHQGHFASPELAAAWTVEIERRLAAYERGDVQASDAQSSIMRMKRYLADRRDRRANS